MPAARIFSSSDSAFCHCPRFSHAEMAAPKLCTYGATPAARIFQQRQRLLPLLALFADGDQPTVDEGVWLSAGLSHLLEHAECSLLVAHLGVCGDELVLFLCTTQ